MEHLFAFVLKASLYGAAVGICILLMRTLLRNKLDARWQYLLWLVLLLKLVIPFGPQSAVSLFNAVPPINSLSIAAPSTITAQQTPAQDPIGPAIPAVQEDKNIPTFPAVEAAAFSIKELLPYLWAAGAGGMLLWLFFSYMLLNRRLQKGTRPIPDRVLQLLERCKEKMGIKGHITAVLQQEISMPSLFGAVKPQILLSAKSVELEDKALEYILLHELAHYKRRDIWINYLLLLLQSLHWFNPVIWYCFKRLREDMELATDQYVLSLLEQQEHRDYGRVLLTLLENFSTPRLAPKLLAMADDKKSIERRLKMIKMTDFFKKRRNIAVLLGILCILISGGLLLTDRLAPAEDAVSPATETTAEKLYEYKNTGEIDNDKLSELIGLLPHGESIGEILGNPQGELDSLPINYNIVGSTVIEQQLKDQVAVVFSLIDKLKQVSFELKNGEQVKLYTYTRAQIQQEYEKDLREYAKDLAAFKAFYDELSFKVYVAPGAYTLAMSSTPGISFLPQYDGGAAKVRYSVDHGGLFTWARMSGKLSDRASKLELGYGEKVYWSPILSEKSAPDNKKITLKVELLDSSDKVLKTREIEIIEGGFYTVTPAAGVYIQSVVEWDVPMAQSLDDAVSQAIKEQSSSYLAGEVATEGHLIVDSEDKGGMVIVYTLSSYGAFGFENGIFTKISGSGAIPTVITFSKDENGQLKLVDYKEPMDGSYYNSSIKKMFPGQLLQELKAAEQKGADLISQQEAQAADYLRSIGRTAEVDADYVEKKLPNINVEASNKLFAEISKYDFFMNSCPYWIGTRESIESGVRYIYETSQGKTEDGYDLMTYRKTDAAGKLIEERKYKIVGSEPQLMQ